MQAIIKEFQLGQHTVTLETGAIARQADGSCTGKHGRHISFSICCW